MVTYDFQGFGGTVYCISENLEDEILEGIQGEIDRIEQKFSRFVSESELNKLNRNLETWQSVDAEFFALLEQIKDLELRTDCSLNIAVKGLLESWGYDQDYRLENETNFDFSGKTFDLRPKDKSVFLYNTLDFGSFGKGYFLDCVALLFESWGVDSYLLNAGGDLVAKNVSQTIYFEDPRNTERMIGEAIVKDLFMASSSPLRRKWRHRHHLVDPQQHLPAGEMLSVYVQSEVSGFFTDAISTALFVMGFDKAKQWVLENPEVQALLISESGEIWKSENFRGRLYTLKTS